MKKRYIVLIVLLVLAVVLGGLAYWQRNNLEALYYLQTMKTEHLQEKIDQNDEELNKALKDNALDGIKISDDDLKKVTSGEASAEDIAEKIIGEQAKPSASPAPSAPPDAGGDKPAQSPPPKDNSEALRKQVATMYVLKASYVAKLEAIVQEAKNEYIALPAKERTAQKKTDIVYGKASALSVLERECDGEVAKVISEVKRLLKESGQDMSLADKLQQTYDQEKSLKKAYYIKELNG